MIAYLFPTLGCELWEGRGPVQPAEHRVRSQGGVLGWGTKEKQWKFEVAVKGPGRQG